MLVFLVLAMTLLLFAWGRLRYDIVAILALLTSVAAGLVPANEAFSGFSHPAVITVAAVLIVSRGLQNAGIVDAVANLISPLRGHVVLQITAQCLTIAVLSAFMNNVGALALMMPVAVRNAYRGGYSPSLSLMPLAFASLLGGMTTLIGTPPNLIISTFRQGSLGEGFAIFDFALVGVPVALAGLLFLVTVGIRLLPKGGSKAQSSSLSIADYVVELNVGEGIKAVGLSVLEIEQQSEADISVVGIVRGGGPILMPAPYRRLASGDVVLLRGDTESVKSLMDSTGLTLHDGHRLKRDDLRSDTLDVFEVIVAPDSRLLGRTAHALRLRSVYQVNLLALSRRGEPIRQRIGDVPFQTGDILLVQGAKDHLPQALANLSLVPLAERSIDIVRRRRLLLAGSVFLAAVLLVLSGAVAAHIAFVAVAAGYVLLRIVPASEVYDTIEWPVIVLLGALFPVGAAMEATGGSTLIADAIIQLSSGLGPMWIVALLLVATMLISDVINNNATALLMAPIAVLLADRLGVRAEPFLMAVAIGASCAFLTPIGHQSNTLVMEPGGYKFGDYWRVGLPLEVVILAVALPAILILWPF